MRLTALLLATGLVLACVAGCSDSPPPEPAASPEPCVESPQLEAAVDAVMEARDQPSQADVWGEAGGTGNNLLEQLTRGDLAAMDNPMGKGVIVSVVYASGDAGASDTARRTGWLVLDDRLYPINVDAAQAFNLLWDGYPAWAKAAAGLADDDYFDFDAYGLDYFVWFNADSVDEYRAFLVAANERCERISGLG